jgi:DNA processing protein
MKDNQTNQIHIQWAWVSEVARHRARDIINYFQEDTTQAWVIQADMAPALGLTQGLMKALLNPCPAFCGRLEKWLAESPQHHYIPVWSADYPALLREIPSPPLGLYVMGNVSAMSSPQIAIVGTRKPSPLGIVLAEDFARGLGQAGFTVTSGLAMGVDACAHQGALSVGATTIGVMATGMDQIYPSRHYRLAQEMLLKGAVVTEFPLGTKPLPPLFPQRNRIISGLSQGVLVVEAALRSGTLTTARHAIEQNRDVFAIPGSVKNRQTEGCHYLLKQGATLVVTVDDMLVELGIGQQKSQKRTGQNRISCSHLGEQDRRILSVLETGTVGVDELVHQLSLPTQEVACRLIELELCGLVQTTPGGYTRAFRSAT